MVIMMASVAMASPMVRPMLASSAADQTCQASSGMSLRELDVLRVSVSQLCEGRGRLRRMMVVVAVAGKHQPEPEAKVGDNAAERARIPITVVPRFMGSANDSGVGEGERAMVENMKSLLKQRRTEEAWQVMQLLKKAGKVPDRVGASRLVAQLAHRGVPSSLARAQQILSYLREQNAVELLDSDALGLLAMASARAGAARYALGVLKLMLDKSLYPSVKVWSAVVSRLGRHVDDCPLALECFDEMCSRLKEAKSTSQGLDVSSSWPDTGAFNAALNACATMGFMEKAMSLWGELPQYELTPDCLSFNILIKMYARTEEKELLRTVMEEMEAAGVDPDQSTLNSLVAAYVGMGEIKEAEILIKKFQEQAKRIESGEEDRSRWGANLRPDVRTYTTMMKGYIRNGRRSDAMQVLLAMQKDKDPRSSPNEVSYTTAISSCVQMGLMDEACIVLQEMTAQKVPANVVTYNVLLKGYCRSRQLQKAYGLVSDMRSAGISLDVVSYNTLIDGCIEMDDNIGALGFFKEMRMKGIAPSEVSYTTLMKAFGRNGQPHQVHQVFEEMQQDANMRTDAFAWNVLLDSYCRSGRMADAQRMFQKMTEARVQPTVVTYTTMVKGYAQAGKSGDVLVMWREIKQRIEDAIQPLQPDEVLLNCLVDTCVRAGYFQRALEVVACMEEKGIPANKTKYKRIFIELYSDLYTSRHASQRRRDRSEEKRGAVEAFKFWLGLPNKYYGAEDWSPDEF